MEISRTHLIEDLNSSMEGKDVIFGGWVVDLRKLGKMAFLTVRDVTGMCQVIVKGDSMSLLEGLNRQSVVRILGKIQASKAKDFDFEVSATEIQVLAKAEYPLPIDPIGRLESDIDNRLNSRALDMRNQKTASIPIPLSGSELHCTNGSAHSFAELHYTSIECPSTFAELHCITSTECPSAAAPLHRITQECASSSLG